MVPVIFLLGIAALDLVVPNLFGHVLCVGELLANKHFQVLLVRFYVLVILDPLNFLLLALQGFLLLLFLTFLG